MSPQFHLWFQIPGFSGIPRGSPRIATRNANMATPVSANERQFILGALKKDLRVDGRGPMVFREPKIKFGRRSGSVDVRMGRTRVMASTTADVVKPYPDRPAEGFLRLFVDFSPMAAPDFDGRSSARSVQLSRMIERGIRESNAVDTEALCIVSGSKAWEVRCDIRVLDDDGNLADCANLAAVASLLHFRRPDVTVVGDRVTIHSVNDRQPVALAIHHIPIMATYALFAGTLVAADPTRKEETVADAGLTFTVNKHREVCGVHKVGGAPAAKDTILKLAAAAAARAVDLTERLDALIEKESKEQQQRTRKGEDLYANPKSVRVTSSGKAPPPGDSKEGGDEKEQKDEAVSMDQTT